MCVRGDGCVGVPISLCVCVCVHVHWCFFPCHTRKGASMRCVLYLERTMGEVEATMGRCARRWSP